MKNTKRIAIMLRPRKDIHERISAAANELDKPITAWVMDAIMERLPKETTTPAKKKDEEPEDEGQSLEPAIVEAFNRYKKHWLNVNQLATVLQEKTDEPINRADIDKTVRMMMSRKTGIYHLEDSLHGETPRYKIRWQLKINKNEGEN